MPIPKQRPALHSLADQSRQAMTIVMMCCPQSVFTCKSHPCLPAVGPQLTPIAKPYALCLLCHRCLKASEAFPLILEFCLPGNQNIFAAHVSLCRKTHIVNDAGVDCTIGLAQLPHIHVNLETVHTNIIIFQLTEGAPDKAVFLRNLRERHGVLMSGFLKGVRAVMHFDVTTEDCKYALEAVRDCLQLEDVSSNGKVSGKAKTELHEHINGTLKGYE